MPRLILGHTTDDSIKIWVRGSARWPVAFVDVVDVRGKSAGIKQPPLQLADDEFYTGVVAWRGLTANQRYKVKIAFGETTSAAPDERIRMAYTEGNFQTFPNSNDNAPFCFLLGSCNLHSMGLIKKPDRVWKRISNIAMTNNARFMVHCGDQIYADIPLPPITSLDHYRRTYLDAWEDCIPAQAILTELPHYMILDDHEITNNFDRGVSDADDNGLLDVAMKVYWEFQHQHNPDTVGSPRRYYYTFRYGSAHFFVMDTRFHRDSDAKTGSGQIIDSKQLTALKDWLTKNKEALKFIVTSVPFVADVKRPKKDKWCDPVYAAQRREIASHILQNDIKKVVFLTGDMHVSYCAKMEISNASKKTTVHELMSSPLNQITPDPALSDLFRSPQTERHPSGISITSTVDSHSFYGQHSNVMSISVDTAKVHYAIHRTSKAGRGPRGFFVP